MSICALPVVFLSAAWSARRPSKFCFYWRRCRPGRLVNYYLNIYFKLIEWPRPHIRITFQRAISQHVWLKRRKRLRYMSTHLGLHDSFVAVGKVGIYTCFWTSRHEKSGENYRASGNQDWQENRTALYSSLWDFVWASTQTSWSKQTGRGTFRLPGGWVVQSASAISGIRESLILKQAGFTNGPCTLHIDTTQQQNIDVRCRLFEPHVRQAWCTSSGSSKSVFIKVRIWFPVRC